MRTRKPTERDAFYRTANWLRLREQALERDHYWCRRCGIRPATIVHHVIPREERPDLSRELDNLESVCAVCHNQLHPERGRPGGRAEQPAPGGIRVIEVR